jgi:hypothetical protein
LEPEDAVCGIRRSPDTGFGDCEPKGFGRGSCPLNPGECGGDDKVETISGQSVRSGFYRETLPDGVRVRIPTPRNWFLLVLLPFWLCGWLFGEVAMVWRLASISQAGSSPDTILYVWLAGWTLGGLFAGLLLLWFLFGEEVVEVRGRSLGIAERIGPIGRTRVFDVTHVQRLRLAPLDSDSLDWLSSCALKGCGLLAFDHGVETVRFGALPDEHEARSVLQELARWIPET